MSYFVEYDEDPGFSVGDNIRLNGFHWRITGIRDNGRGLWLTCEGT
jgi:hypothetical protein